MFVDFVFLFCFSAFLQNITEYSLAIFFNWQYNRKVNYKTGELAEAG